MSWLLFRPIEKTRLIRERHRREAGRQAYRRPPAERAFKPITPHPDQPKTEETQ